MAGPARRGWAIGLAAVIVFGAFFGYMAWLLRDLPEPGHDEVLARSIVVYDREGHLLAERNPMGQFHVVRTLGQMGPWVPSATLAAEDRSFYSHGAVDPGAIARAAASDVASGGFVQGGSTITQQLVKIQLLTPRKTIDRKLQEAALAWALEHRYSKDQVLEMYLNRVYYGHGAYGIGAAAKTYFGSTREPSQLTAAQAAFLAGLIEAPAGNDPQQHFERARARQLYVLQGMVKMGKLTPAEERQAEAEPIQQELRIDTSFMREPAPHFVDFVVSQLERQFGAASVQQGGFRVYTTLDPHLQSLAEKAVKDGVVAMAGKGVNNGDLLAVRPNTGEILAWVGSADYSSERIGGQYDVVTSPRQPGSSFKPYVYAAALRDHVIASCTLLDDAPTNFSGYRPVDFDNSYMGRMPAQRALLLSRNIPAVQVASKEGITKVIDLAHELGIRSRLDPALPTAIGASEVTMLEHVQAYQALANGGARVPITGMTRVIDRSGSTVYSSRPGRPEVSQQVLSPAESYLIADILKDYSRQWSLGWGRRMAGKSGTTGGSQVGVHPDAWMMAYSPDIVIGAWAGNTGPNGKGQPVAAFGTDVGSTISREFINGLPAGEAHWYAQPGGLVNRGGQLFLAGAESLAPTCGLGNAGEGGGHGHDKKQPQATPSASPQDQEGD